MSYATPPRTSAATFGADLVAVSAFFARPWEEPVAGLTDGDKVLLLHQAGFELRALGRLTEAVQSMRAGLKAAIGLENWVNATTQASILSELVLTLGDVSQAMGFAEENVELADQSGDAFQRMVRRTASDHLDRAVDGLRKAGQEQELPHGLLARAALRRETDDLPGAKADLDEAEEIADRGRMLLFLCDVHLEWTRFYLAQGADVEARRHLGEAKGLVEECGYGRRAGEVAELEAKVRGGRDV